MKAINDDVADANCKSGPRLASHGVTVNVAAVSVPEAKRIVRDPGAPVTPKPVNVATPLSAVALAPAEHGWRLALAKLQLKAGDKAGAKAELDRLAALGASFAEHGEVANLRSSLTSLAAGR